MKKILFGTSALIATTFASVGGASAAGLELGFSGSYTFGAAYIYSKGFQGSDSRGAYLADGELIATARGTLDNGLTFGARIELNIESGFSNTSGRQIYDESVGWVEGSFGRIEVGHEDGAHDRSTPGISGTWFNAADGGGFLFDHVAYGDWGFDGAETSDAMKVTYWTPSFSGLRAGVSYVPNSRGGRNGPVQLTSTNDAWELGARYTGNFNDVSVDVGGGYTIDPYFSGSDDSWAVSGNVGFGQFTIGAAYEDVGYDLNGYAVGGSYNTGPWTFGAAYGRGDSIRGRSNIGPGPGGIGAKEGNAQGVSVGVDYELGQGVVISAGGEWIDPKNAADRFSAGLVTQLSF